MLQNLDKRNRYFLLKTCIPCPCLGVRYTQFYNASRVFSLLLRYFSWGGIVLGDPLTHLGGWISLAIHLLPFSILKFRRSILYRKWNMPIFCRIRLCLRLCYENNIELEVGSTCSPIHGQGCNFAFVQKHICWLVCLIHLKRYTSSTKSP